jgi:hypothetical protein
MCREVLLPPTLTHHDAHPITEQLEAHGTPILDMALREAYYQKSSALYF